MASISEILDFIRLGRISNALSMLEELTSSDRRNRNEVIRVSSRFNRLQIERNRATITAGEYEAELNTIVESLLFIIDKLDESEEGFTGGQGASEIPLIIDIHGFLRDFNAIKAAVDEWGNSRNERRLKSILARGKNAAINNQLESEVDQIMELVPVTIIESIERRVRRCWDRYEEILNSDRFLPGEIDEATEAVIKCICRELKRLLRLNGEIPSGIMRRWWNEYSCDLE